MPRPEDLNISGCAGMQTYSYSTDCSLCSEVMTLGLDKDGQVILMPRGEGTHRRADFASSLVDSTKRRIEEVAMIRDADLIGFAGLTMVVLGTWLLFPSSADRMNWKYWLGGLALWFAGFASVVGWLLWRWSVPLSPKGKLPLLRYSVRQSQEENRLRNEKSA